MAAIYGESALVNGTVAPSAAPEGSGAENKTNGTSGKPEAPTEVDYYKILSDNCPVKRKERVSPCVTSQMSVYTVLSSE